MYISHIYNAFVHSIKAFYHINTPSLHCSIASSLVVLFGTYLFKYSITVFFSVLSHLVILKSNSNIPSKKLDIPCSHTLYSIRYRKTAYLDYSITTLMMKNIISPNIIHYIIRYLIIHVKIRASFHYNT